MEYKYKMLNPPRSTQSIDFKLSETYLENCLLLSPAKAHDSLTYTVSMETIQDHESPFKGLGHHYFHSAQRSHQFETQGEQKSHEAFNLYSHQPIISIKIQPQQPESLSLIEQKSGIQISLDQGNDHKNEGQFTKKNIIHVTNLKLQTINEEVTDRKSLKMGKVMTRIHSQIKENRSITRSRIASRKTLQSPTHQSIQSQGRAHSQKKVSAEKRYQNMDKINENNICAQNFSQIKGGDSKLSKTNASSNQPYSPEMVRRKSDYCNGKIQSQINVKSKSIFLSDRSPDRVKKLKSYKNKNPTNRERIMSAFASNKKPETDSLTISSKGQEKYGIWNNQTHKAKILDKLKENQCHLTSSIVISSIKPNFSDRNKQNKCPAHKKMISNFMSDENTNNLQPNKQVIVSPEQQKQFQFTLNRVQINALVGLPGVQGKKNWRKMRDNFPKKLFCV